MANRGRQTFNKRLKEQQRKEKQQEKFARKMQRKIDGPAPEDDSSQLTPLDFIPGEDAAMSITTDADGDSQVSE